MSPLAQLRAQGLHITAAGNRLLVSPREALGDAARTTIRVNKASILRELATEASERRAAVAAARDAAGLGEWVTPLIHGRLVVCGNCVSFQFGDDPAGLGRCTAYDTAAAAFIPFPCEGFEASSTPTASAYLPDSHGARAHARAYAG